MPQDLTKIPIDEFTTAAIDGTGVFDVLMQANKAHLLHEFEKGRIKGPEYANVYLGSLEQTMQTAVEFFIQSTKSKLEALLIEKQIELADKELELMDKKLSMADCEQALCQAQIAKLGAETDMIVAQMDKIPFEIALAEAEMETAQENVLIARANLAKIPAEIAHIEAQTSLVEQNTVNAVTENDTMLKQQCKLDAEYEVLMQTIAKVQAEASLLGHKSATELAQTQGAGVDSDSIIGRQKLLYTAQTEGFTRNAEHAAAKLMADTWSVRRTTDETGESGNSTNKLDDQTVGRAISKLLAGVGA